MSRQEFESETVAATIDGQAYTIADLRQLFDSVADPKQWKAPWAAYVPAALVPATIEAVKFFHADIPEIVGIEAAPGEGRVLLRGKGYQAW